GGGSGVSSSSILTLGSAATNTSAIIDINGSPLNPASFNFAGTGANHQIINTSGSSQAVTINVAGALTFPAQLGVGTSNHFGVTKTGAGVLRLTATNNYTGQTRIQQ